MYFFQITVMLVGPATSPEVRALVFVYICFIQLSNASLKYAISCIDNFEQILNKSRSFDSL
jgi:hypothetical protein